MFAKLKKRVESDRPVESPNRSRGGGLSRTSSVTSLPGAGSIPRHGTSPPGSITSEDFSIRDSGMQKEELMMVLQKKTDQCRKLEGNVSDLAALIKDKSKNIEKLEASLKKQDEVTNKKLDEQKAEFEKYRDKLIEGYQEDKGKLEQEKKDLGCQLKVADEYKVKYFKKEEETDEYEGLTTQELAKVKHMLLIAEDSLGKCQSDLQDKSEQLTAAKGQVDKLATELGPLKDRLTILQQDNAKLKDETLERAELVTKLTKEKSVFDTRLNETNKELTEKQLQIAHLQGQLGDMEGGNKALQRNSDLHKNKTNKLLQEKDDHIDALKERVETLEQRVSDSTLSGDDKASALQTERNTLEMKLSEARQQLTEVKVTWSDKITHLEDQISHLNTKLIEDSEELTSHHKHTEQMRDNFHTQIEDLRQKLEEAEKRALEQMELAASKDTFYEKQLQEAEKELRHHKMTSTDSDTQLRAKVDCLEEQLAELTQARDTERSDLKSRIERHEQREITFTEQETKLSREAKDLERKVNALQIDIDKQSKRATQLEGQITEKDSTGQGQNTLIADLKEQLNDTERDRDKSDAARVAFENRLRTSEEEKGSLLDRNADMLVQLHELKASHASTRMELQRTLDLKSTTIESMQDTEADLREQLGRLKGQLDQSEAAKAESGASSEKLEEMTDMVANLTSQMTDKNRTIKKQEQTLKDLRLTLQRELKVQSLPNDDPSDLNPNNTSSPTPSRKSEPSGRNNNHRQQHHQHNGADRLAQQHFSQPSSHYSSSPTAAVLPMQAAHSMTLSHQHSVAVRQELMKGEGLSEVNVQYLKHVVLKFMLSRESEAVQLIRAVSMLLNFSPHEQKLIKETLEWKMSWFGQRPPLGKGQTSKVIPPTL